MDKTCGDCTACCSGALNATIFEHKISKGVPCPFVCKSGCTIYEKRPETPCKSFNCGWLIHPNIPDYMRPDKSGVILKSVSIGYATVLHALQYKETSNETNDWLDKVKDSVDYKLEIISI